MGILFTILMGILFTITIGILFTIVLGIQFTISNYLIRQVGHLLFLPQRFTWQQKNISQNTVKVVYITGLKITFYQTFMPLN